ncbi:MAG TPA: MBL fold metallo-hydrolase [Micromonosporaceae bacterium]|jgi:glyoxylase-like metal-dependent hydrolase (beta-lactamase superfamily II)
MPVSRVFGGMSVIALDDGAGPFYQSRTEAFPGSTPEQWRRADAYDPGAVTAGGEWLLRFRCFAIRLDDGTVIIVDAGIGAADSPAATWAPVPGRLPDELAAADIRPDDVKTVVLTHLHTDHVGWAVTGGAAYFRNATYLLQGTELSEIGRINPALVDSVIAPLRASGQLATVNGERWLGSGLRVVATPGHTPGHQSVKLDTPDGLLVFTGDLLVHAIQLLEPDVRYAGEMDPDAARASRTKLLDYLATSGGTLATAHLAEPFVRV